MNARPMQSLGSDFQLEPSDPPLAQDDPEFKLPSRAQVVAITRHYLAILMPQLFDGKGEGPKADTSSHLQKTQKLFTEQISRALRLDARCHGKPDPKHGENDAAEQTQALIRQFPQLASSLDSDIEGAFGNDPAALTREEIVLSYPGLEAVTIQRLAHRLYLMGVPFVPRMMTEVAHSRTGIDIHPGASIGESFFIDHGTGVVIGETATIGNKVTLYHGVTLGAFNPLAKDDQGYLMRGQQNKRHPDLEDHVTVYPNATVLGGNTRVGHHSIIGGNVWLTHSVAPYSTVVVKDPELVIRNRARGPLNWDI